MCNKNDFSTACDQQLVPGSLGPAPQPAAARLSSPSAAEWLQCHRVTAVLSQANEQPRTKNLDLMAPDTRNTAAALHLTGVEQQVHRVASTQEAHDAG